MPRQPTGPKSVLGLIHSYICGPMSVKALNGFEYFLTFIDDHSRKTWIYFLKTKDEVFCLFKEFKALVENLIGKKIKVLHLDNGGEYVDKDFANFFTKEGIIRECTTPNNLEQNGVAERKNRTIVEATRAMLYDQDMPKFLWASAHTRLSLVCIHETPSHEFQSPMVVQCILLLLLPHSETLS